MTLNSMTLDQKKTLATIGHPKHLDQLVSDEDPSVRLAVAEHGNDSHRDKLVSDKHPDVRVAVARHGNKDHATKLLKDKDVGVKSGATQRLKELEGK